MNENTEISGKQIASFIALTVAISAPMAIAQDDACEGELISDASVQIVQPQICRYAGPEYFGFGKTEIMVKPETLPQQQIPQIPDTAQYMQLQNNILNDVNNGNNIKIDGGGTVNINNVKPNNNFMNTEYGSVKVIDPAGHYIFK